MKLHTLLEVLPLYTLQGEGNPEITNIRNHHEKVKAGDLFICIAGLDVDSHTLAKEAVNNGAVALLSERPLDVEVPVVIVPDSKKAMAVIADFFYNQPSHELLLVGVTGTNGKTTTTHLIEKIYSFSGMKTGLIGTLYVKIGEELEPISNTTPDSLTLQQTFRRFCNADVKASVMEVSSHALVQGRVHGCDYDIAVFTNLSQDHLDYHKTMEEYRNAKGLLFSQLGNSYFKNHPKYAVINLDDPNADFFMKLTSAHVITYGLQSEAYIRAKNLELTPDGSAFTISTPQGEYAVKLKLAGKFNVYNALAAISTAYVSDIPIKKAIEALEQVGGVSGRFESVKEDQAFSVIVDYAHTPDGLKNVLETIQTISKGNIYVVVGCGGDRDKGKRPIMANIACEYSDYAIFTSDNPRMENPLEILKDMESGVIGENYELVVDRKEAITKAIQMATNDDVVLIAGKGHETYQVVGKQVLSFDDREVARNAIREL